MLTLQTILDTKYDDVSTGYTLTEITDFHKAIWHETREASLNAMVVQELCSASENCAVGKLDLHIPGSSNILALLFEPVMGTGSKIVRTMIQIAEVCAAVVALYLLIRVIMYGLKIYRRCKIELAEDLEFGEELQPMGLHPAPSHVPPRVANGHGGKFILTNKVMKNTSIRFRD